MTHLEAEYFHRVHRLTMTRLWINNPTLAEAKQAIAAGAVSCTTNPSYSSKMLLAESEAARVHDAIRHCKKAGSDASLLASQVQREVVRPIQAEFLPIYREANGRDGFVSVQGDPIREGDPDSIVSNAIEDRKLGENIIAKVPVTAAGLQAIPELLTRDIPVIATEVMSVSQAVAICEAYEQTAQQTGHRPPFYVTHITGIFDEYLAGVVAERKTPIEPDILWAAGIAVARRQYRLMKERGYSAILLGGGARALHHFTEFVGGDVHITINWRGTADELIRTNPPVVGRIDCPVPGSFIDELINKIPEFRKAYVIGGLEASEFSDFGPVELFRNSFIRGWKALTEAIDSFE